MVTTCPKCATDLSVPDSAVGKPVKCGSCGNVFRPTAPQACIPAQGPKNVVPPAPLVNRITSPLAPSSGGTSANTPPVSGQFPQGQRPLWLEYGLKYAWLWLIIVGVLLGSVTGTFRERSSGTEMTTAEALPALMIGGGIAIVIINQVKKKRERENLARERERLMLAQMSPSELEAYLAQQELELRRQQERSAGARAGAAIGLGWYLADKQREATEKQTRAIEKQTEALRKQGRR